MDAHLRRHSIGSSTGSLSDDLLYSGTHTAPTSSFAYGAPQAAGDHSYTFSDAGSPRPDLGRSRASSSRHSSFSQPVPTSAGPAHAIPPALVPLDNTATAVTPKVHTGIGTGRSRARGFTFLGARDALEVYGERHDAAGATPHTGATPFVGSAYDFALDGGDDEDEVDGLGRGGAGSSDDDDLEMREVGEGSGPAVKARTNSYRTRFQPLVSYELAWMAVSAASVLGLTVTAVVFACVG